MKIHLGQRVREGQFAVVSIVKMLGQPTVYGLAPYDPNMDWYLNTGTTLKSNPHNYQQAWSGAGPFQGPMSPSMGQQKGQLFANYAAPNPYGLPFSTALLYVRKQEILQSMWERRVANLENVTAVSYPVRVKKKWVFYSIPVTDELWESNLRDLDEGLIIEHSFADRQPASAPQHFTWIGVKYEFLAYNPTTNTVDVRMLTPLDESGEGSDTSPRILPFAAFAASIIQRDRGYSE